MGFLRGILGVHSIDQIAYEIFFFFRGEVRLADVEKM